MGEVVSDTRACDLKGSFLEWCQTRRSLAAGCLAVSGTTPLVARSDTGGRCLTLHVSATALMLS